MNHNYVVLFLKYLLCGVTDYKTSTTDSRMATILKIMYTNKTIYTTHIYMLKIKRYQNYKYIQNQ